MAKFEVYVGNDFRYHWRLKALNGEIVCWGEGYNSKQGALTAIAWVKVNSPKAPVY